MQTKLPTIDIMERGATRGEVEQAMDRRLFMRLQVYQVPVGANATEAADALAGALAGAGVPAVVYADAQDPRGIGLLVWSEDPSDFVTKVRPLFSNHQLNALILRPEYTMLGRTYALGHEQNLEWWIIDRPAENATNTELPWAVWYPLRRKGAFEGLSKEERNKILHEHSFIGRAYGAQNLANDIRLACHGIDQADNDFVIGLLGKTLHPLSHVVESMRKTVQTSMWMEKMGPFFVGYVLHRVGTKK